MTMKASELIKYLRRAVDKIGDHEVRIFSDEGDESEEVGGITFDGDGKQGPIMICGLHTQEAFTA